LAPGVGVTCRSTCASNVPPGFCAIPRFCALRRLCPTRDRPEPSIIFSDLISLGVPGRFRPPFRDDVARVSVPRKTPSLRQRACLSISVPFLQRGEDRDRRLVGQRQRRRGLAFDSSTGVADPVDPPLGGGVSQGCRVENGSNVLGLIPAVTDCRMTDSPAEERRFEPSVPLANESVSPAEREVP
jgi:hypothetical protein